MESIILRNENMIYSLRVKGKKYELLKDNGNVFKEYDENYWEWWKKKVSYFDEKCDILIIYSDDLEIDNSLNQGKNKEWNSFDIIHSLDELKKVGISLEYDSYDEKNQILRLEIDGKIKEFGVNKKIKFSIEEKKKKITKKKEEIIISAPKGSLADYYRSQTKSFEG